MFHFTHIYTNVSSSLEMLTEVSFSALRMTNIHTKPNHIIKCFAIESKCVLMLCPLKELLSEK